MDIVSKFTTSLVDLAMIFGPTSGYYFQYQLIKKTKSLGSFSIDICAILIFCNILRIFFWYLKRFETALLYQSIVMIVVQVKTKNHILSYKATLQEKYRLSNLWRWDDYESYIESIVIATGFFGTLTFMFMDSSLYAELLGCASVVIEACLGLPQLISNWRNKSTAGLSFGLIMVWFTGDFAKTLYFIFNKQPTQFILCGITQLVIDISILGQIYTYGKGYQELAKKDKRDTNQKSIALQNRRLMGECDSDSDSPISLESMKV